MIFAIDFEGQRQNITKNVVLPDVFGKERRERKCGNSSGLKKKHRHCSHGYCGVHPIMSDNADRNEEEQKKKEIEDWVRAAAGALWQPGGRAGPGTLPT